MLPFDVLTAGSLLIMAASSPSSLCMPPEPARINVIPKSEEIKYDYSKNLAALQAQSVDTVNPYDFGSITHTKAFMRGSVSMSPSVRVGYKDFTAQGASCIWYDTINIEIAIDPTIVIASEVYADSCMRRAVLEHEMKHVNVDRQIVNKYAQIIGQKVYNGLKERGFSAGPIPTPYRQAAVDRMNKTVSQLIDLEYKKMNIERQERQQAVDSLQEYESVGKKCPSFDPGRISASGARLR
ncbi:MAG: hypothetical protein KDJ75_04835 [Alphaproteobacteria bacterium]|nr:hypothetical protein [Alphaproteobacteria bacterium]